MAYDVRFENNKVDTLDLLNATSVDLDSEIVEYESAFTDLVSYLTKVTVKDEPLVDLNVKWCGIIDRHVVIYFEFDEVVKSVDVDVPYTCVIDDESRSVAIKLKFGEIQRQINIEVKFISGKTGHLSQYKVNTKELSASDENENALFLLGSRKHYNVSTLPPLVKEELLDFEELTANLILTLTSKAEADILTVTFVNEEDLQLLYQWSEVTFGINLKQHIFYLPALERAKTSLDKELNFIINSVTCGVTQYNKFRTDLLRMEEETDMSVLTLLNQ